MIQFCTRLYIPLCRHHGEHANIFEISVPPLTHVADQCARLSVQPQYGEELLDFIPSFMRTQGARECQEALDTFLTTNVAVALSGLPGQA